MVQCLPRETVSQVPGRWLCFVLQFDKRYLGYFKNDYYRYGKFNLEKQVPHLVRLGAHYHRLFEISGDWTHLLKVFHALPIFQDYIWLWVWDICPLLLVKRLVLVVSLLLYWGAGAWLLKASAHD